VTLALEDIFIQQRRSSEKKSIRPPRQGWNVYRVVLLGDSHPVRGAMFHAQTRLTQRRCEISLIQHCTPDGVRAVDTIDFYKHSTPDGVDLAVVFTAAQGIIRFKTNVVFEGIQST